MPYAELRNAFFLALYGPGEKREQQDQLCSKQLLLATAPGRRGSEGSLKLRG